MFGSLSRPAQERVSDAPSQSIEPELETKLFLLAQSSNPVLSLLC